MKLDRTHARIEDGFLVLSVAGEDVITINRYGSEKLRDFLNKQFPCRVARPATVDAGNAALAVEASRK